MNGIMFVYTLGDILAVVSGLVLLCFFLALSLPAWWRRLRCKHEHYHENSACQAVCSNCRKDLGFIGTIREERRNRYGTETP